MALTRKHALVAAVVVAALALALHALPPAAHGDAQTGPGHCAPGDNGTIKAYLCVAAKPVWEELIRRFEEETCIRVEAVYGASGRLLAQLSLAGDGDVYAPASPIYLEKARERGLVAWSTTAAYLEPAILVPRGNPAHIEGIEDLARPGVRVALADPESVAVGAYAKRLLQRLGLWERVRNNTVAYASSFSHLVSLVASGAVDAALGWRVGAEWYPDRVEAIPIPRSLYGDPSPVPVAVLATSKNPDKAMLFARFVASREAAEAWRSHGYLPAATEEPGR